MLDPKHIQALSTVVSEGSFSGAAKLLNLTPAAVTQRIKSLEAAIGSLVLIRGKALRLTPQGKAILSYQQKAGLLEQDLMQALNLEGKQYRGRKRWHSLRVAINADSLATWLLPGVAQMLAHQNLLLDVVIDDQDHTHEALQAGEVIGCVTTLADPMRGCLSEPLGIMRYRCVASRALIDRVTTASGQVSAHRLLAQPAIIFNRKDVLQDRYLLQHLDLHSPVYPKHFMPALDAFETAIGLGLGWGMVPELSLATLQARFEVEDLVQGWFVDVALYWQHWAREATRAAVLSQAIKAAARQALRQTRFD